jgi:hypothetical protein
MRFSLEVADLIGLVVRARLCHRGYEPHLIPSGTQVRRFAEFACLRDMRMAETARYAIGDNRPSHFLRQQATIT